MRRCDSAFQWMVVAATTVCPFWEKDLPECLYLKFCMCLRQRISDFFLSRVETLGFHTISTSCLFSTLYNYVLPLTGKKASVESHCIIF